MGGAARRRTLFRIIWLGHMTISYPAEPVSKVGAVRHPHTAAQTAIAWDGHEVSSKGIIYEIYK